MKILVDECVWQITRDFLRQLGHEVASVEDYHLTGSDDQTVLAQATADKRVFLTRDMHFANILIYPPSKFEGIIVLRIKPQTTHLVHKVLKAALEYFQNHDIAGTLTIVNQNSFRIKKELNE